MKIDHIGIAVNSIEEAKAFYEALGLVISHIEVVDEQGVKTAFLKVGESNIELLEPINESSPVYKFLQKRGKGIHHIAINVEGIENVLERLKGKGVRLINEKPVKGAHGKLVAFVHPASTGGVLLELCETKK
ncbi:methylmalonyl-CoA/ethylmalonyl-CoA epimerase [Thermotomaculum hydrothermale]|uniref:Methylmalonyl-CoA/ethylmalonyl-CoA epimerase n=1 Tax=Thermotomaculum hydrothermale TaxID=981385 RepID=A0A7R6PGV6_9BACT|nr:methylmalonyl-CoA epimerase [Thermotomaculum hydrothermale]BBB32364.1 methylmalonyl-CoA/ethylmalonyl-CoA epimerase [Thermotomaculum hydrothermale]